ncbi:hypothetical protein [Phenylobacterium sp.]|jgi:hypothetical protein|uniref:hypothetical protein n=1 Tax=Phenylobacterium sp. TaxID=1871053 RepID=UPI002F41779B
MNKTIERTKLIFIGIFAVANVAILVWTLGWARPQERCEEAHKWWDGSSRVCAQPILTSDVTGRMITDAKARAEALKELGRPVLAPAPAPKP